MTILNPSALSLSSFRLLILFVPSKTKNPGFLSNKSKNLGFLNNKTKNPGFLIDVLSDLIRSSF